MPQNFIENYLLFYKTSYGSVQYFSGHRIPKFQNITITFIQIESSNQISLLEYQKDKNMTFFIVNIEYLTIYVLSN